MTRLSRYKFRVSLTQNEDTLKEWIEVRGKIQIRRYVARYAKLVDTGESVWALFAIIPPTRGEIIIGQRFDSLEKLCEFLGVPVPPPVAVTVKK